MFNYIVTQKYASIFALRNGLQLDPPMPVGEYPAANIIEAIRIASKETGISAILLSALRIRGDVSGVEESIKTRKN